MTTSRLAIRARESDSLPRSIIVTDAHHAVAVPFIRSLGRAGWQVIAASPEPSSMGFRSRHAALRVVYPSPSQYPRTFVERLARVATDHATQLVIPLSDGPVRAIDRYRQLLPCPAAIPESAALAVAMDKQQTIELAERLGVPVPATRIAHTPAEAADRAAELRRPYALKRARASNRLGTLYAKDPGQAERQAARLLFGDGPVLVQEFHRGQGVGVELLLDGGRPLLAFQHRRLREVPVSGGASALRVSTTSDDELYEHSLRILAELRWTGLAMVEFRVGPEGHRLMEINGRAWGSLPLAVAAGVDFPLGLANLYASKLTAADAEPPTMPPMGSYRIGVRSRNLELDVLWILSVLMRRPAMAAPIAWPPRREALVAASQLLDRRIGFDVLSASDPGPGAVEVVRIARSLLRRLPRR